MGSITSWNRLEPVARQNDVREGQRARVADPLWMLARQWQFGELNGEDAGSPVESILRVEVATIDRFHAGGVGTNGRARAVDLPSPDLALEALVEAQPPESHAGSLRLRIEAGQHFMRILRLHKQAAVAPLYQRHYPLEMAAPDEPSLLVGVARRGIDGVRLAHELLALRGTAASLGSLPALPQVPEAARAGILTAANAFLTWWGAHHLRGTEGEGSTWDPRRLEYACAVSAKLSDGEVVLRADQYPGGALDWYDFSADSKATLGPSAKSAAPRMLTRRALPTRAFYAGMPAERFWEFEDASVRFGAGSVGRTDLAHMLLDEFALTYGNDWYVVPVRLPVGSVSAVRGLTVRDTFGVETHVSRADAIGASNWKMYCLSRHSGAESRVADLLFLPPALGAGSQGDPIEEVVWFRDEMANMVWAVEKRIAAPLGGSVEAKDAHSAEAQTVAQALTAPVTDAELVYRLNSTVPDNWFPLVPVQKPGPRAGEIQLQLQPLTRWDTRGVARTPLPKADTLRASSPLIVEEEEVTRAGLTTRRHWQITRDSTGHYHLWLSHRSVSGAGEGSSGLVFDIARPAQRAR